MKVKFYSCNSVCKLIKECDRLKCLILEVNIKCIVFFGGDIFLVYFGEFWKFNKIWIKIKFSYR